MTSATPGSGATSSGTDSTGTTSTGDIGHARHGHTDRALTPDVARGLALLGIALVNVVSLFLYGRDTGPGGRLVEGTTFDHALDAAVVALVENRAWPMFALLFGFGMATIAERLTRADTPGRTVSLVLVRRNLWLAVFGAVQVVLVFFADILAVYGLTGLVLLVLLHRRVPVLLAWATVSTILLGVGFGLTATGSEDLATSPNWVTGIGERLGVFVLWTAGNTILPTHLAPMIVGVLLHRVGVLRSPGDHVTLLRRMALWGGLVGVGGGLPLAVAAGGWWVPSTTVEMLVTALHAATGLGLGLAYVSIVALWVAGRTPGVTPRGPAAVLAAAGQRSLTCYLTQSLLIGVLMSPWGVGFGGVLTSAQGYGLAVGVWLVSVGVGWGLSTARLPGPFEVLLRRLSYGSLRPVAAG